MNRVPNTTGLRVFVDPANPETAPQLVLETRKPLPYVRALMIAYERLENAKLSALPVRLYDMSRPYPNGQRLVVPPPYHVRRLYVCDEGGEHAITQAGYCRKCGWDVT